MLALQPSSLKLIGSNSNEFLKQVQIVADYLGILPEWLLVCFFMESRFNPKAMNNSTQAIGLIQFMPATLKGMGLTTQYVEGKTNIQQLVFVQKYLQPYKGKMKSLTDVYLTIFYPLAITKDDSFVIGSDASANFAAKVASQNGVYDLDHNGRITKGEIKKYIEGLYFQLYPDQKKKLFNRFLNTL